MARCQGTTKAGAQCKRNVAEGADYCSTHAPDNAAQAKSSGKGGASGHDHTDDAKNRERGSGTASERHINSGEDLLHLAIGVAVTVAMFWLLKRGPRFPGF